MEFDLGLDPPSIDWRGQVEGGNMPGIPLT
jgi:hypothetical protein